MSSMTSKQAKGLTTSIREMRVTILAALPGKQTVTWADLKAVIEAAHIVPAGGWMVPRSALQMLINQGVLTRTADVMTETYTIKI